MRTTAALVILTALTAGTAACSAAPTAATNAATAAAAPTANAAPVTAQTLVHELRAAGFTATIKADTDSNYVTQVGGSAYSLKLKETPGTAGINMFPNPEALAGWVPLSKQFGGVAVTAGSWAVSLPTSTTAQRDRSLAEAPKIAAALGGTVQK
ncbi:hypothetical protein ABT124_15765 [Streptomyces sp. NPDC001982]|uniref:hypothetical protein n=1 Tax=Streptomyces sp. NPDC001982 TaxID=3154405 RepID=UPI0033287ADC